MRARPHAGGGKAHPHPQGAPLRPRGKRDAACIRPSAGARIHDGGNAGGGATELSMVPEPHAQHGSPLFRASGAMGPTEHAHIPAADLILD